jgi:DNA helicase-2/ATP-dependent DNA helicase PcrA
MTREGDLTPRQHAVVASTGRVTLVLGGAGCGKTTVALWAARAELERTATAPWQRVGFLTFSRTAVDQIGSRSRAALAGLGTRIEVSTFHGFAYRLVRSFGRYSGLGLTVPVLQSEAQAKLLGDHPGRLRYDHLVPLALRALESPRVRELVAGRWPLVVCDEFQDTSADQWKLLTVLGERSRLLLLADPHQMIYGFLPGVGPERLETARRLADVVIELEPASHRDPSGAIPAMAHAVRQRAFRDEAVTAAVDTGRLRVITDVEDAKLVETIGLELSRSWRAGARSFGIFGHSNEGVAWLGHGLTEAGIEHVLVGLPDAQAEALSTMTTLLGFACNQATPGDVRTGFAAFLTACTRGGVPRLASDLAGGRPLPEQLEDRLRTVEQGLSDGGDLEDLLHLIGVAWDRLGITVGLRPWARAVPTFAATVRRANRPGLERERLLARVRAETNVLRTASLLDSSGGRLPPTQLMNFHQTKGREADVVLLVYRDGDYLASHYATEPFNEASRVLYVSLTRARKEVAVILPPDPHPLVRPFTALARTA